jgi:hypothetical protein
MSDNVWGPKPWKLGGGLDWCVLNVRRLSGKVQGQESICECLNLSTWNKLVGWHNSWRARNNVGIAECLRHWVWITWSPPDYNAKGWKFVVDTHLSMRNARNTMGTIWNNKNARNNIGFHLWKSNFKLIIAFPKQHHNNLNHIRLLYSHFGPISMEALLCGLRWVRPYRLIRISFLKFWQGSYPTITEPSIFY